MDVSNLWVVNSIRNQSFVFLLQNSKAIVCIHSDRKFKRKRIRKSQGTGSAIHVKIQHNLGKKKSFFDLGKDHIFKKAYFCARLHKLTQKAYQASSSRKCSVQASKCTSAGPHLPLVFCLILLSTLPSQPK